LDRVSTGSGSDLVKAGTKESRWVLSVTTC